MGEKVERHGLARPFERAARACQEAVGAYLDAGASSPTRRFSQTMIFAIALLDVSSANATFSLADARLIRDACHDAAEACRRQGFDEAFLLAAAALEQAAGRCEQALGAHRV